MSSEHSPIRQLSNGGTIPGIGHNGPPDEIGNPTFWYELIDEKTMAPFMGVTVRSLQKWRQTGDGPQFVRLSTRNVKYRRIDGRSYSESRLRSSTSDPGPEANAA